MSEADYRAVLLEAIAIEGAEPQFPIAIHKTRPTVWVDEYSDEDIAGFVFKQTDFIYSFWRVTDKSQILLAAHFLSSGSHEPLERSVHFVSLPDGDLTALCGDCVQEDEHESNACRGLRGMHFNCSVAPAVAAKMVACMRGSLMRVPKRSLTATNHELENVGCRHFGEPTPCDCETAVATAL